MRLSPSTCFIFLILGVSLINSQEAPAENLLNRIEDLLEKKDLDAEGAIEVKELINTAVHEKSQKQDEKPEKEKFKGKSKFNKPITTENLLVDRTCNGKKVTNVGNTQIQDSLQTQFFNTEHLTLEELTVDTLYNPHSPIVIDGSLELSAIEVDSSIETTNLILNGFKQWNLLQHDHFQDENSVKGWSLTQLGSCEQSRIKNRFLGGHCLLNKKLTKVFDDLPPHSNVRVVATVHLLDNWEGETIYLKLGDNIVWTKKGLSKPDLQSPDLCGNNSFGDPNMNLVIDQTVEHSASKLELTFDTNMKKDACEASYAIDDVFVYVQ